MLLHTWNNYIVPGRNHPIKLDKYIINQHVGRTTTIVQYIPLYGIVVRFSRNQVLLYKLYFIYEYQWQFLDLNIDRLYMFGTSVHCITWPLWPWLHIYIVHVVEFTFIYEIGAYHTCQRRKYIRYNIKS